MAEQAISPGPGAIGRAFAAGDKRAALMPYMMGGFPDLATSLAAGRAYVQAGADLIELGVPFSDPLADGPAIQAAGERALAAGATFDSVIEQLGAPLAAELPVVAMCYVNPILRRGLAEAVSMLVSNGVSGLIVPDLPAREAGELRAACDAAGLDLVPLVAPTTPDREVAQIAADARGFVYVVSVTGVTGERSELSPDLADVVARVRSHTSLPVAVGFGVGTPEQAAQVGEIADGVIVGSRLVRALGDAPTPEQGVADAGRLAAEMAAALR